MKLNHFFISGKAESTFDSFFTIPDAPDQWSHVTLENGVWENIDYRQLLIFVVVDLFEYYLLLGFQYTRFILLNKRVHLFIISALEQLIFVYSYGDL